MQKNTVLKYLAILLIFCITRCVTHDSTTELQSNDVSIGRGLFVEAPPLIEANVAVYPQLGHNGLVWNVTISPDNAYIISADKDNSFVNMWKIQGGRLLRTFWGHDNVISALAYSPDGKTFASGDAGGTIKIWNIESGTELHTISEHSADIFSLGYSPDGKRVVSASRDRTITIWDAEKGTELYVFGDNNGVTSATYSPDGRYIVSSSEASLVIWDAGNGRKQRVLSEGELVWWASWSKDSKKIVSVNEDGVISVWNAETGIKINSFSSGNRERQKAVFTSENAIVSWSYGGGINTWNTETGQKIKERSHSIGYIVISGDNTTPDGRHSVCISNDGRFLIAGTNRTIDLIDYNTSEVLQKFTSETTFRQFIHFSPRTQQIIINRFGIGMESLFILQKNARLENYEFMYNPRFIADGKYSRDGKRIVTSDRFGRIIRIHDAQNGEKIIKQIEVNPQNQEAAFYRVAFSPDGKYVVIGGEGDTEGNIKIWELGLTGNGHIVRSFSQDDTDAVSYSPDGKYIVSGHSRTIKLWNTETYREIYTLRGHTDYVSAVSFSPDGKYLASGSEDAAIRIWDIQNRKELLCIDDGIGAIRSIEYSPDGRCLLVVSYNGSVYLYDVSGIDRGLDVIRNRRIAQIVIFTNGEWIILTPDGYYNASPAGDRYLNVRVGNTVSGIDSYRSIFYNPEVVLARLNGRPDPASKATVTIQQASSFTPPTVTINSPERGSRTNTATTNLSVNITDQNQPIKNIKIMVNGRLVGRNELSAIRGTAGLQAERASLTVTGETRNVNFNLPLSLDPGRNQIEVVAFNGYSESRSNVEVTWNAPAGQRPALPNLWILAVGVNNYDDSGIQNLNFCVADAKGVIDSLKTQEGRRYAKVNSLLIADGERISPTAESIRQNLKFLDQAGERDVVLLFLAGHGVSDNAGKFFFLPRDTRLNADKTVNENTGISDNDIVSVLDRAGNLLVFIDACQSGGVDNDRLVRSLMDTNAFVFASSRGQEKSQERRNLGHGVFTYSIMQGLRGAEAARRQENITVVSLSDFVSQEVSRITEGAQNPRGYSRGFADFPMALINAPR